MVEDQATVGATAWSASPEDFEQTLVARVRAGDERAFEALYVRHHRRLLGFVLAIVKDHARAEDITQEVFISALRHLRSSEGPVLVRPWLNEIARNACIDAHRRSCRRVHEVSLELDAAMHSAAARHSPPAEEQLAIKQTMTDLRHAFAGLPAAQHELLVMRELDGLSYREIGERTGMSRAAVESVLFRARRRLLEEYEGISSGEHCRRVHGLILAAVSGPVGVRERVRMARHVRHCAPCRRHARRAGVDPRLLHAPQLVAALIPAPGLLRRLALAGPRRVALGPLTAHAGRMPVPGGLGAVLAAGLALSAVGVGAGLSSHPSPSAHARRSLAPPAPPSLAAAPRARTPPSRSLTVRSHRNVSERPSPPRPRRVAVSAVEPPPGTAGAVPAPSGSVPAHRPPASGPSPSSLADATGPLAHAVSGAGATAAETLDRVPAQLPQAVAPAAQDPAGARPALGALVHGVPRIG